MPFWFWNDTLKADEIVSQIKDFDEHGVYGFVIHPRMGLPKGMRFLSSEMLALMKVAIETLIGVELDSRKSAKKDASEKK